MSPLYIIIIVQFVFIVYRDVQHQRERKDLYNRLMSRNIDDYKRVTTEPKTKCTNFLKNSISRAYKDN